MIDSLFDHDRLAIWSDFFQNSSNLSLRAMHGPRTVAGISFPDLVVSSSPFRSQGITTDYMEARRIQSNIS